MTIEEIKNDMEDYGFEISDLEKYVTPHVAAEEVYGIPLAVVLAFANKKYDGFKDKWSEWRSLFFVEKLKSIECEASDYGFTIDDVKKYPTASVCARDEYGETLNDLIKGSMMDYPPSELNYKWIRWRLLLRQINSELSTA